MKRISECKEEFYKMLHAIENEGIMEHKTSGRLTSKYRKAYLSHVEENDSRIIELKEFLGIGTERKEYKWKNDPCLQRYEVDFHVIREQAFKKDIMLKELAITIGVTAPTFTNKMNMGKFKRDEIYAIEQALGLDEGELIKVG